MPGILPTNVLPLALELDPSWYPCDGPLWGVRHGANVLSNLPFLVIGLVGLLRLARGRGRLGAAPNRAGLWASVALLAFGSGAFHFFLTPLSLAADRACICAILAFVVAETLAVVLPASRRRRVTLGALAVTEGSVLLWWVGATSWPYGALQTLGGLLLGVLAVHGWRTRTLPRAAVWGLGLFIACYALAKGAEVLDQPIHDFTGCIAGHPVKHLLAAAGLASLLPWLSAPAPAVAATPSPTPSRARPLGAS